MRRIIIAAAATTLIGSVVAACGTTSSSPGGSGGSSPAASAASCSNASIQKDLYTKGVLTVATDNPVFTPWFVKNKPSNGQGYESAVAYAIAHQLGFSKSQVVWVSEPFSSSYAAGPKKFDFDINEISYTPSEVSAALAAHRIDALVTDTPTAQYMASAQLKHAVLVAQFPSVGEHYGLLFHLGNPLVTCVNKAIATLKANGTLHQLQQKYLQVYLTFPTIQP